MVETLMFTFRQAWFYLLERQDEFMYAVRDHLEMVGITLGIVLMVSIPLGIWTARSKLPALVIMNAINGMRVMPSLAVLFLVVPYLGLSTASALVALIILALPPVLINTDAGFRSLDKAVLETARGMGMSGLQILLRVEFPLAMPVILAGVKTAAVEVIASATLAAFVGSGGLGIYITRGFALFDYSILMVGAVPVALLTLLAEAGLSALQRLAQPG